MCVDEALNIYFVAHVELLDYYQILEVINVFELDNDAMEYLGELVWPRPWNWEYTPLLMVSVRSHCERLLVFDADEYVMIELEVQQEIEDRLLLKSPLS